MSNLEVMVLKLSQVRFANSQPLKSQMYDLHNSFLGKSKYIKKWEDKNSRCGSCIRRVQTNILKHYYNEVFNEDSELELRTIDGQDGRPLFRVKAEEAKVVEEVKEKEGEEVNKEEEDSSTHKQPTKKSAPKKRGRKPKSSK